MNKVNRLKFRKTKI